MTAQPLTYETRQCGGEMGCQLSGLHYHIFAITTSGSTISQSTGFRYASEIRPYIRRSASVRHSEGQMAALEAAITNRLIYEDANTEVTMALQDSTWGSAGSPLEHDFGVESFEIGHAFDGFLVNPSDDPSLFAQLQRELNDRIET